MRRATPDLVVLDAILGGVAWPPGAAERFTPSPGVLMLTESVDEARRRDEPRRGHRLRGQAVQARRARREAALLARPPEGERSRRDRRRGRLRIDTRSHEVSVDGRALALTATEYALLLTLARDAGSASSAA
ncbi:MAG: hypothetical protein U0326_22495 [Polyangiales bacterium]